MSNVTHPAATRNAIADEVVDALDLGTTNAAGQLVVKDGSNNTLVELALSNPAAGAASGGVATLNAITSGAATASGTAAEVEFQDRDETVIFEGKAGVRVAVGAVNQGSKTFTIAGNFEGDATLAAGETIRITGSTGNDGTYRVVSATDNATNTDIVVEEAIPSATADGNLHTGAASFDNRSIATGQTVACSSATYTAPA